MCFILTSTSCTQTSNQSNYANLFNETAKIVEENFYNPVQIKKEFPDIKKRYRKKLKKITTHEAFSKLINSMLGELKSSHTYYLTTDDYEYYQLAALFSRIPEIGSLFKGKEVKYPTVGIITQRVKGKTYIAAVLAGSRADKAGLLKGDEILSVNGKPFAPVTSLKSSVGSEVTFKIRRRKNDTPLEIKIKPVLLNPKKEMLDAQKASIRIIEQYGKKIGYIHIYSYAGEEYHKELHNALVFGKLKKADSLIIDLRYGLGGAWPYYLNIFNRSIPALSMINRNGKKNNVDSQWRKPAVYLVNRFSRSGKELLAFGAKKYKLATVIGEKTPGHTLGGRLFSLSNGDLIFLAVSKSLIDGVSLEGVGVEPDVEVLFDSRHCAGKDLQLEKAVEYLVGKKARKKAVFR